MEKAVSIEDFYSLAEKVGSVSDPEDKPDFRVFKMDDFVGPNASPIPYNRKNYYKFLLIIGHNRYNYADKSVEFNGPTLFAASPMVPYNWESLQDDQTGYFCIFTEEFLNGYGNIKEYPFFQPGTVPIFSLDESQTAFIEGIFKSMFSEVSSDYSYRYEVIKTFVMQLIHQAMKLTPIKAQVFSVSKSSERITRFFFDLLERQFPIESPADKLKAKTPSEFASFLSVHVNHLNRSLKLAVGQTTSQIIAGRVLQEARMLLKRTNWAINEIGYCLGFEEPSHFIAFFKRYQKTTPRNYRISNLNR
jgi:AraC family transcriptional activator of pobA